MVIAGNRHLLGTINQSSARRGYESLDQFRSRLMMILNLDDLAASDDGGLYTVEDVRRLYEYGGISLKKSAIKTLRKICKVPQSGRVRTCSHIFTALHQSKLVVDELGYIDTELILAAINQLGLPVMQYLPFNFMEDTEDQKDQEDIAKTA